MTSRFAKISCMAFLVASGLVQAATPCDGFKIKIKNKLADDLVVSTATIEGAVLEPKGIQKISKRSESTFTVNKSIDGTIMPVELTFNTMSLPTKKVTLKFNLKNKGLACIHDGASTEGDLHATSTRLPGSVTYTIK
ncbi:MAG: hypothetical protein H2069_08460 [Legionella sp.]|nr:hypothetical protein [Legionella sp.]